MYFADDKDEIIEKIQNTDLHEKIAKLEDNNNNLHIKIVELETKEKLRFQVYANSEDPTLQTVKKAFDEELNKLNN